jgi:hypothetical protein
MFWVPIWVHVSYSHSGFDSEKLYIGESSGRKLGFTSHSGRLSLRSRLGPVWVLFGSSLGPVWVLFGSCLGPVWVLFGSCLGSVWGMFGSCSSPVRVLFVSCLGPVWVLVEFCSDLSQILVRSCSTPIEVLSWIPSQIYKTIRYSLYSHSAWGYLKPSLICV